MQKFNVFIIENDPVYRGLLFRHLSSHADYEVTCFATSAECLDRLYQKPGLIVLDYTLVRKEPTPLLPKIRRRLPETPIVVMASTDDIESALLLVKEGVSDCLVKQEEMGTLLSQTVARITQLRSLQREVALLRKELDGCKTMSSTPEDAWLLEEKTMRDYTLQILRHFLRKYERNVVGVAGRLAMGKSTIYKMIKSGELKIDD